MSKSIIAAVVLMTSLHSASAVALNGRSSDDSVCDLSPYTTSRLSQRTFVPARTPKSEEIYARLALRFIVSACRQGQLLILHSDDGSRLDDRYFNDVATKLCGAGGAVREAAATADDPHAFRMRCLIKHLSEARSWLRDSEAAVSTEHLIATGSSRSLSGRTQGGQDDADRRAKCEHTISYGALVGVSGGCRE